MIIRPVAAYCVVGLEYNMFMFFSILDAWRFSNPEGCKFAKRP